MKNSSPIKKNREKNLNLEHFIEYRRLGWTRHKISQPGKELGEENLGHWFGEKKTQCQIVNAKCFPFLG